MEIAKVPPLDREQPLFFLPASEAFHRLRTLQARNENLLYRVGIQAWASHEPATKYLPAESLLTILDGENELVTMLPGSSLGFLHHFLIAQGFSSISLGAAIRNPSSVTEVPYDDSWTLNRPGGMFSGESFTPR